MMLAVSAPATLQVFIGLIFLLAGCATFAPERGAAPTGEVRLTPQWRTSTGSNARTVEVFMENGTKEPLALSNLALDGVTLPALPPTRRKKDSPPMPLWWRVAPAGEVAPGGHVVIAVCFTNAPAPLPRHFSKSTRPWSRGLVKWEYRLQRTRTHKTAGCFCLLATHGGFAVDKCRGFCNHASNRTG